MSVLDEFAAERDAMLARCRRGVARDDNKTVEDWGASLRKVVLDPGYGFRRLMIKVGGVALRAVESFDRKAEPEKFFAAHKEQQ